MSHSIMMDGLIFGGNFSHSEKNLENAKNMFQMIIGCRIRDSCRYLFKNLKILTLQSQLVLSLLSSVVNKKINSN